MTIGNDLISLYNDYNMKSNISLNNVQLYYGYLDKINNDKLDDKICGIMGFKLHSTEESYYTKFKSLDLILKANNITNYTFWTIEFFGEKEKKKKNDYDGYLILGAGDNKYLKDILNISHDEISYSYSSHLSNSIEWMINFEQIYYYYPDEFNITKMHHDSSKVELNFDIDYYFSTKQYFESIKNKFFELYISKGICRINKLKEFYLRYQFITCNKEFNKELIHFPKLSLVNTYYNHTFILTYNDLFIEANNEIIFLMFYNPWNPNSFMFGKNFMKKYQFIFRYDQKNIGFLKYNEISGEKNTNNTPKETILNKKTLQILLIVALSIVLIGIIILGVYFLMKKCYKKRKKRANELDDENYEYDEKAYAINE